MSKTSEPYTRALEPEHPRPNPRYSPAFEKMLVEQANLTEREAVEIWNHGKHAADWYSLLEATDPRLAAALRPIVADYRAGMTPAQVHARWR